MNEKKFNKLVIQSFRTDGISDTLQDVRIVMFIATSPQVMVSTLAESAKELDLENDRKRWDVH